MILSNGCDRSTNDVGTDGFSDTVRDEEERDKINTFKHTTTTSTTTTGIEDELNHLVWRLLVVDFCCSQL